MQANFHIGSIPVYGRVSLAPMDGISDQPFRLICKKMGSALIISEFINAMDVHDKLNDFTKRTSFTSFERPFGIQIYGSNPVNIVRAAIKLEELGPDFIDLNLGCSVRRIANRGAGAGLLIRPDKVIKILQSLVKSVQVPITIKIRIGWDQSLINYLEIAKIAEGEGAQMICAHARRKDQSWDDPADWEAIARIKNLVNIPVLGNGDVASHADIDRMLKETGCDGVMIGRAALGNPWIFSNQKKEALPQKEILETIIQHWLLMIANFGQRETRLRFKKHLKAYLTCHQFSYLNLSAILRKANPIQSVMQEVA
jgi:nifR3 family TIM-barrel protein